MGTTSSGRWLALLLVLASCGGEAEEPRGSDPIAPGAEAPVDDDLAAVAGDWAVATVFVRLERWPEVRDAILASFASEPSGELRAVLEAPLVEALAMAGSRKIAIALRELRGVDSERPMVLRFGETDDDGLATTIALAKADIADAVSSNPGGLRHVLAVPAADPDLLEPSLRRALAELCPSDRWVDGVLECRGWRIRLQAEDRWVFAVWGELDEPLRGSGRASGTLRWAMDARWPAAAHFRHDALRGVGVHHGLRKMAHALSYASSDYVEELYGAGLSEVLSAHAQTAPHRVDLDEAALAIRSSPAALLFVGHLTPRATDALARQAGAPANPPARTERQHLEIRSALPLRGAARAVEPPFAVDRDSPQAAVRSVMRGGPFSFFGTVAQPLGAARLLIDLSATEVFGEHVRYVHDDSLGAGGLRAHLDIAQIARVHRNSGMRDIAALVPALHLDARVEGATVAGAIGVRPEPIFEVPALPAGDRTAHDPAQVRCLEELELHAVATLQALRGVDPSSFTPLLEEGKQEARAPLGCITEPSLRTEAEGYLEALDAIAGRLAPAPPSEPQNLNP